MPLAQAGEEGLGAAAAVACAWKGGREEGVYGGSCGTGSRAAAMGLGAIGGAPLRRVSCGRQGQRKKCLNRDWETLY